MRTSVLFVILLAIACGSDQAPPKPGDQSTLPASEEPETVDTMATMPVEKMEDAPVAAPAPVAPKSAAQGAPPMGANQNFADVKTLDPSIRLDIKYATTDNFTKSKIYDCPRCLLRPEAAEAIVKAHKALKAKGLGLKMFDCYRPRPYQQRLWDKVPDPNYVTPPAKGSMHSRGAAVDLTLVDLKGNELDMGTPYDFFGREAHTDNLNLPKKVLENRKLLRETLLKVGFKGIRTEWWHFSFQGKNWPLSDYVWPCD
jgi:D-alanyl-D-alanine dipeptidase